MSYLKKTYANQPISNFAPYDQAKGKAFKFIYEKVAENHKSSGRRLTMEGLSEAINTEGNIDLDNLFPKKSAIEVATTTITDFKNKLTKGLNQTEGITKGDITEL